MDGRTEEREKGTSDVAGVPFGYSRSQDPKRRYHEGRKEGRHILKEDVLKEEML
jgi:hypothetical protein